MALDDAAFRSRDYVIAVDEETDDRAGFGRIRIHKTDDGDYCELTGVGVLPAWRGQGVGAHVVERLIETAAAEGFETVYSLTDEPGYLTQFGFEPVESSDLPAKMRERLATKRETVQPDAVATSIAVDDFGMPSRLREAFKNASPHDPAQEGAVEDAEDFGIDSESATYKYDTGR
jgi:N-acetylglutamate synthase-like GNAT family acetyltransferase